MTNHWVDLQNDYHMYCCIVDWHSLTADFTDTSRLREAVYQMAIDFLAAGHQAAGLIRFRQAPSR